MNRTMSPGCHSAASGYARHAARQATSGSYGGSPVQAAELARAAPFAAGWPLQSYLELGALPGAVPCARLHTRQVLWEWGQGALSDETELLVSELATNALQISRATARDTPPPIRLWLVSDKVQTVIMVWDASPLPPVPEDAGEDAETGRGLLLVEAVSERWGFFGYDGGRQGRMGSSARNGRSRDRPWSLALAPARSALPRCGCAGLVDGVPRLLTRHPRSRPCR